METTKKEPRTTNDQDTSAMGTMEGAHRATGIVPMAGAWLRDSLPSNSLFPWPLSVRRVHVFPLSALSWLYGALVSRLQTACNHQDYRWHGLFPIAVELCCLFGLVSRAPLRYAYDKVQRLLSQPQADFDAVFGASGP